VILVAIQKLSLRAQGLDAGRWMPDTAMSVIEYPVSNIPHPTYSVK
jgi:hypothetical protein